jgi:integration host factor subunit alpha
MRFICLHRPLVGRVLTHHAETDSVAARLTVCGPKGTRERIMGGKTLKRADLAEALVQKVGLPRNESQDMVEIILKEISDSLASGDQVKLSSFGSFGIRSKGERIGRNPKTGEEVPITPRRVLVFKPSNIMKETINQQLGNQQLGKSPRSNGGRSKS